MKSSLALGTANSRPSYRFASASVSSYNSFEKNSNISAVHISHIQTSSCREILPSSVLSLFLSLSQRWSWSTIVGWRIGGGYTYQFKSKSEKVELTERYIWVCAWLPKYAMIWAADIPFSIAVLTCCLSNFPTTRFGYRIRISTNRFRIAISSSFAESDQLKILNRFNKRRAYRYKRISCNWSPRSRTSFLLPPLHLIDPPNPRNKDW